MPLTPIAGRTDAEKAGDFEYFATCFALLGFEVLPCHNPPAMILLSTRIPPGAMQVAALRSLATGLWESAQKEEAAMIAANGGQQYLAPMPQAYPQPQPVYQPQPIPPAMFPGFAPPPPLGQSVTAPQPNPNLTTATFTPPAPNPPPAPLAPGRMGATGHALATPTMTAPPGWGEGAQGG